MAFKRLTTSSSVPEGPDRLFLDLPRRKHPSLLDHQGQTLRAYTANALNAPDVALQLPTGSGKTLVGILIAEWRRRKFHERAVYLCPTRQLVNQVAWESANKYGIAVESFTGPIREYTPEAKAAYRNSDRIAITTYNSVFNTNPFFHDAQLILVDDVHASENYIASTWTVRVRSSEQEDSALFRAICSVLKPVLDPRSYERLAGERKRPEDAFWVDKVPNHRLAVIAAELRIAISENISGLEQDYPWRLISDHLVACQVYISSGEVLIRPLIPPTWTHHAFTNPRQRVFMSATLGEGGDLERLTGRPRIVRLPVPAGWDQQGIGRRLFMFPEMSLTDSDALRVRADLMRLSKRSLVLTTSDRSSQATRDWVASTLGFRTFSPADLEHGKQEFVNSENSVAILANRYDGMDFPDEECRLVFIEGIPRATNLQERFIMSRMGANVLFNERVRTRVTQATGRCTRGLTDYSAVIVAGQDLLGYITDRTRRRLFHPEFQAELEFGIQQSTDVGCEAFVENLQLFLEHEAEWEEANQGLLNLREGVTQSPLPAVDDLENSVIHEIEWQTAAWADDWPAAFEAAREVLGCLESEELRGYRALWHYLAGSAAELVNGFQANATEHYTSAKRAAASIPWLAALSRGRPDEPGTEGADPLLMAQVEALEGYLERLGTVHNRDFSAREREIRSGLDAASSFESAQVLLGRHLGFDADNQETDGSPDPWWALPGLVIVFEDHAGAKSESAVIAVSKARQAASHPNWIRYTVPGAHSANIVPVLVTPARHAKEGAIPHLDHVSYWHLEDFRTWADGALEAVRRLRRAFRQSGDLAWRVEAASILTAARAAAPGLAAWLQTQSASRQLSVIK